MAAAVRWLSFVLLASAALPGCACRCPVHFQQGCGPGGELAGMKYDADCEVCGDPSWGGPGGDCPSSCGCASPCGAGCGNDCGCGDACCDNARSGFQGLGLCKVCRGWLGRCGVGRCDGCGPLYWDEWCSDPPACCDPCDACGHYRGGPGAYVVASPAPYYFDAQCLDERPRPSVVPPLELAERPSGGDTADGESPAEEPESLAAFAEANSDEAAGQESSLGIVEPTTATLINPSDAQ